MSNKISRRTFLKVTGASAAALGAAAVLGGCQAGDNSSIEVKVGDKISNWNNLAVQLTSVFTLASAPDAEGYEYIAMLITSANRSSRDTFAIGAQNILEIGEAYPLDTPEQVAANTAGYFHALSASTTDFSFTTETFTDAPSLPPQRSGYIELVCMVPTTWQQIGVTYTPTFVSGKTLNFTINASDLTKA